MNYYTIKSFLILNLTFSERIFYYFCTNYLKRGKIREKKTSFSILIALVKRNVLNVVDIKIVKFLKIIQYVFQSKLQYYSK